MKQAHICLDETLGIRYAILPGDPARLDRIAKELTDVQELAYNREFRSLRGKYKGVDVLALSTGIGGSSAGIAVEELRNIGITAAIRIGSCGALQKGIGRADSGLRRGARRRRVEGICARNFPGGGGLYAVCLLQGGGELCRRGGARRHLPQPRELLP